MIHHLSLGTNDLAKARKFYDAVFAVIGLRLMQQDEISWHYGVGHTEFSLIKPANGKPANPGNGTHVAFEVEKRQMVDEFYKAALANGGQSDGEPGIRAEYDKNYYAAFVRDPDGNKIEIVTFMAA